MIQITNPFVTGIAGIIIFLIGLFVYIKRVKSRTHFNFFLISITLTIWFCFGAISMYFYEIPARSILWFKIAYLLIPFLGIFTYQFSLELAKKQSKLLPYLYGIAVFENIIVWLPSNINHFYEGLNFGVNVGLYWTGFPIFSYVLGFGLIKFLTLVFMSVLILKNAYRGAKNIIYKQQFKTFYILFVLFFILGFLDWLVVFGSKFHPGWFIVPPFFILMAYNISRYHIFDIKTTIHKTMAWLLSSLLIYAPFIFMVYLLQIIFRGRDIYLLLSLVVLINIFIVFRNKIQPLLNFVFKKGEVQFNQKITEFLKKLNKNFYLKDLSEDFVKIMLGLFDVEKIELIVNDKKSFKIIKSQVYNQELKISKKNKFSFSSMFLKNLIKIDDILLKEEVEVNPKYKLIKKETLNFFRKRKASIIIPLIFQDKVFAFIIMGSKRGKDYFSINEIQALKNIKEKVTFLFYNSLYFVGVQTLKRNRESLINKEVREKTKQIIEKTEELEKMNKFMVGRELKIRELKQELKRWKK